MRVKKVSFRHLYLSHGFTFYSVLNHGQTILRISFSFQRGLKLDSALFLETIVISDLSKPIVLYVLKTPSELSTYTKVVSFLSVVKLCSAPGYRLVLLVAYPINKAGHRRLAFIVQRYITIGDI